MPLAEGAYSTVLSRYAQRHSTRAPGEPLTTFRGPIFRGATSTAKTASQGEVMRALVAAAAGFLGRHVARRLPGTDMQSPGSIRWRLKGSHQGRSDSPGPSIGHHKARLQADASWPSTTFTMYSSFRASSQRRMAPGLRPNSVFRIFIDGARCGAHHDSGRRLTGSPVHPRLGYCPGILDGVLARSSRARARRHARRDPPPTRSRDSPAVIRSHPGRHPSHPASGCPPADGLPMASMPINVARLSSWDLAISDRELL